MLIVHIKKIIGTDFITLIFFILVLQKAGHHMEDTLIAAYTALLTGYCIMEDEVSSVSIISRSRRMDLLMVTVIDFCSLVVQEDILLTVS